jgi:hypothetical protein
MSIASLPSLSLSLSKQKSTSTSTANTNTNTITNNIIIPSSLDVSPCSTPRPKSIRLSTPAPIRPRATTIYEEDDIELEIEPYPEESPKDRVSMDFMKTLIRIQTELILNNISLINNLKELGDKVIYRKSDLVEMISILMGVNDIQITTEEPKKIICGCAIPLYVKIKNISIRRTLPFLHTEIATRLQEEFKISLEFCIPSYDD